MVSPDAGYNPLHTVDNEPNGGRAVADPTRSPGGGGADAGGSRHHHTKLRADTEGNSG